MRCSTKISAYKVGAVKENNNLYYKAILKRVNIIDMQDLFPFTVGTLKKENLISIACWIIASGSKTFRGIKVNEHKKAAFTIMVSWAITKNY